MRMRKILLLSMISSVALVGCSLAPKTYETEVAKMQEIIKAHQWKEIPISEELNEKLNDELKQKAKASLDKNSSGYLDALNNIGSIKLKSYVSEVVQGKEAKVWSRGVTSIKKSQEIIIGEVLTEMSFNCKDANDDRLEVMYLLRNFTKIPLVVTRGMYLNKPSYVTIDMYGKDRSVGNYKTYMNQQNIEKNKPKQLQGFDYRKYACTNIFPDK